MIVFCIKFVFLQPKKQNTGTNYILGYIASPSAMDLTMLYRKSTLFSAPITPAGILLTPLYRNCTLFYAPITSAGILLKMRAGAAAAAPEPGTAGMAWQM